MQMRTTSMHWTRRRPLPRLNLRPSPRLRRLRLVPRGHLRRAAHRRGSLRHQSRPQQAAPPLTAPPSTQTQTLTPGCPRPPVLPPPPLSRRPRPRRLAPLSCPHLTGRPLKPPPFNAERSIHERESRRRASPRYARTSVRAGCSCLAPRAVNVHLMHVPLRSIAPSHSVTGGRNAQPAMSFRYRHRGGSVDTRAVANFDTNGQCVRGGCDLPMGMCDGLCMDRFRPYVHIHTGHTGMTMCPV